MPHFSAVEAAKVALMVIVVLGTVRIITLSYPDNAFSQAMLALY